MVTTQKLWLDANEYGALVERLESQERAARDRDAQILAQWAESDSCEAENA